MGLRQNAKPFNPRHASPNLFADEELRRPIFNVVLGCLSWVSAASVFIILKALDSICNHTILGHMKTRRSIEALELVGATYGVNTSNVVALMATVIRGIGGRGNELDLGTHICPEPGMQIGVVGDPGYVRPYSKSHSGRVIFEFLVEAGGLQRVPRACGRCAAPFTGKNGPAP